MKELADIVAAWDAVCRAGGTALLATVVGVSGSTYRRPGARMLMTPGAQLAGSISGGCLEGDLLKKAWWRTEDGPVVVTYDSTGDDDIVWGFGLGCNGVVQVLLERVSPSAPGPLAFLRRCLEERQPGVIATVTRSDSPDVSVGARLLMSAQGLSGTAISDAALAACVQKDACAVLAQGTSRTESYPPGVEVFLECIQPPPPLVVFGAGRDALPVVRLAKELGWHVTVVDTRAAQPRPERFPVADTVLACSVEDIADTVPLTPQTDTVVMTHNYPDDRRVLQTLLQSPVGYIGQLGPRARTERLLAEISDDGFEITSAHRERLHGPVGLDIGADNPEEIALSIIAEMQAARAGRPGSLLRERQQPLHPRSVRISSRHIPTETASCPLPLSA